MNDLALLSDCLVPRLMGLRLPLLCFSGVSRAMCGVMAGAVGVTMTAHFARRGNLADVSAKSASLGTLAQLVGMVVYVPFGRGLMMVGGDSVVASDDFHVFYMDDVVGVNIPTYNDKLQVPHSLRVRKLIAEPSSHWYSLTSTVNARL